MTNKIYVYFFFFVIAITLFYLNYNENEKKILPVKNKDYVNSLNKLQFLENTTSSGISTVNVALA